MTGGGGVFVIEALHGQYGFLSNFYLVDILFDGERYPSVEHAFQAAKCHDPAERVGIRDAATPKKAKRLGRMVDLRLDWEHVKLDIMRRLLVEKFTRHDHLRHLLLDTGDAHLVEGNHWGDTFWGVCRGVG